ncbi:hypothetical protein pb186bvf_014046, partial [Paramecium bursaria]
FLNFYESNKVAFLQQYYRKFIALTKTRDGRFQLYHFFIILLINDAILENSIFYFKKNNQFFLIFYQFEKKLFLYVEEPFFPSQSQLIGLIL